MCITEAAVECEDSYNDDHVFSLTLFEQKIIDGLALSILDPDVDDVVVEEQAVSAALLLGCSPAQAAVAGAKRAVAVGRITRRYARVAAIATG